LVEFPRISNLFQGADGFSYLIACPPVPPCTF
jgi:hypothetical protein